MERFAVIGLGRFGTRLATLLADAGAEVIAVDRHKELVEAIRDRVTLAVCLDSTDEEALRSQAIDKVDVAIVGIGTAFEDSALTTVILKQLGVPRVISRATTSVRGQILTRIGADGLVNPERESADRWRNRLVASAIMERIDLAEGYSLVQIAAPESFFNKTLTDLDIRRKHQVNVVAIRRTAEETDADGQIRTRQFVISVPMADSVIKKGDVLLLIGSNDALEAFPTG
ncbi:MAG: TrkA family potassium uptake protein [Planctomycetota bacterium]|nr:TrkA family potassium uptake protein [Planctomycetota bacterium]